MERTGQNRGNWPGWVGLVGLIVFWVITFGRLRVSERVGDAVLAPSMLVSFVCPAIAGFRGSRWWFLVAFAGLVEVCWFLALISA
jgi:hypothetical protein